MQITSVCYAIHKKSMYDSDKRSVCIANKKSKRNYSN